MAKQSKKRNRLMISPQSAMSKSSSSPITAPSPSAMALDDEYERALAFLRDFRSQRVAAFESSSDAFNERRWKAPLHVIIESEAEEIGGGEDSSFVEDELVDEFSLALSVIPDDQTYDNASSSPPRMKKTAKSQCLIDLVEDSKGGSQLSCSSSSIESDDSMAPSHDDDHYFDFCLSPCIHPIK
ncbi:hypothetical protein ACHAW5_007097 [Stephanodiscus triporus]|uniref:Uncharacterized protein n=1 Tax=Stephanodiscus triporus TaxID=2934178 RepID=A0ABD3NJD3_9STRA